MTDAPFRLDPVHAGGAVAVERVLLGHLIKTGLTRGEVALLVRAAYRGSGSARRVIETRTASRLSFGFPNPCDYDLNPVREWTDQPVATAMVEIAPGLSWRHDTLHDPLGALPATVASAAIGRPVGDLLSHPDIDPAAVAREPGRDLGLDCGILRVAHRAETVHVPVSPLPRLRAWRLRLAQRRSESTTPRKVRRVYTTCAAVAAASVLINPPTFEGGALHVAVVLFGLLPLLITTTLAVDSRIDGYVAQRLAWMWYRDASILDARARSNHLARLRDLWRTRGYDDRGDTL